MDSYLGTISIWTLDYAPRGWLFCTGQELSIQQNSALFALLGTRYGGNGTTTFKLPDLRGRLPLGSTDANTPPGGLAYPLAQAAGSTATTVKTNVVADLTITKANLPAVSPTVTVAPGTLKAVTTLSVSKSTTGVTNATDKAYLASTTSGPSSAAVYLPDPGTAPTDLVNLSGVSTQLTGEPSVTIANLGDGTPLKLNAPLEIPVSQAPYLALNFIICVEGIFPPRP